MCVGTSSEDKDKDEDKKDNKVSDKPELSEADYEKVGLVKGHAYTLIAV